ADGAGKVTYSKVSTANLDGKGSITGDSIIEVSNGTNATLGDVSLSLADNSVTSGKLNSGQAAKGTVAT
ncbi:hypothetical protein, partial [Myroides injenensis]|uniref:hypothetical protein n=1 Tax=Myroides injenensis TaxID=1183151 RepID=UPI0002883D62